MTEGKPKRSYWRRGPRKKKDASGAAGTAAATPPVTEGEESGVGKRGARGAGTGGTVRAAARPGVRGGGVRRPAARGSLDGDGGERPRPPEGTEKVAAAWKEEAGRRARPGIVGRIRRDAGPGPGGRGPAFRCRGVGRTGVARPGIFGAPGGRRGGTGGRGDAGTEGGGTSRDRRGAGRGDGRTREEASPQAPSPPRERKRIGTGRGRRYAPDGGR